MLSMMAKMKILTIEEHVVLLLLGDTIDAANLRKLLGTI